jgi:hypothetical protein
MRSPPAGSVSAGNGADTGTVFDDPLMKDFFHKPDSVRHSVRIPFLARGFGAGCRTKKLGSEFDVIII